MKTFRVIQQGDRWMVYFTDDGLFGATPFSPRSHTKQEVEQLLMKRNPGYIPVD